MTDYVKTLDRLGGVLPIGSDSLLPLDQAEIQELESLAGAKFPKDYRQFLSQAGGFVFNEEIRFPTIDPLPPEFSRTGLARIGSFFASARARAHHSATLHWNIEQSPDYYPDDLFAIGQDGGGGKILLDLAKSTKGNVLYFPQSNDWYDEDLQEEPFLIANTFEEFVQSLRKREDVVKS